ncbi:MAG: SPOR domain-containing protein [Mariprofundales bacterium]
MDVSKITGPLKKSGKIVAIIVGIVVFAAAGFYYLNNESDDSTPDWANMPMEDTVEKVAAPVVKPQPALQTQPALITANTQVNPCAATPRPIAAIATPAIPATGKPNTQAVDNAGNWPELQNAAAPKPMINTPVIAPNSIQAVTAVKPIAAAQAVAPVASPTRQHVVAKNNRSLHGNRGYYVQSGAFKNTANAQKNASMLETAGYSVRQIGHSNGLTLVWAGPWANKGEAAAAQRRIRSKLGLNGYVVSGRYNY